MNLKSTDPIGLFDSGLGGLTVAHAILKRMPQENLVYFGDTAHLPWGEKSVQAIQQYALKICELLLNKQCKCIVIACHTASTTAYEVVKNFVQYHAPDVLVLNVLQPIIDQIRHQYANQTIGLIGTKQTVRSNTYLQWVDSLNQNTKLVSLATPLLVPIIEDGFLESPIAKLVVDEYLSHPTLAHIQALILGCTHYPLLKNHIEAFYNNSISILDSSQYTANTLYSKLVECSLLNHEKNALQGSRQFYLSDANEFFAQNARLFFGAHIKVEEYPFYEFKTLD